MRRGRKEGGAAPKAGRKAGVSEGSSNEGGWQQWYQNLVGREVEMAATSAAAAALGTVFMTSAAHKEGERESANGEKERERGSKNNTRRNNNAESACLRPRPRSAGLVLSWGE